MPIDHKRKAIFIHIPRTGGTSIEKALGLFKVGFFGENNLQCPLCGGRTKYRTAQHITAVEAEYHFNKEFNNYFKFTFVRNPYTRALSVYRRKTKKNKMRQKFPTFEYFVREFITPIRLATGNLDHYSHVRDQVDYLLDANSQQKLDFTGRFETYQRDWNTICAINRWQINLGRHNVGRKVTNAYNKEIQDLVYKIYERDFDLLEYPSELPTWLQ